ncbi:MAG TPA: PAS domain-containing protein, partial [Candidatus Binatus sp.]|nr:PAS domain-containing protein [Candidatus Binatus sp.]
MNIDTGFLATINVLPEPMLLVDTEGKIHVANSAAARYLQVPLATLKGLDLGRLVADPPEAIRDYLGRCARSGGFLPGAMSIRMAEGEPVKHRTFAARADIPSYTSAHHLVLMRVGLAHGGSSGFAALNAKIGELSREITRRKRMEADLRRSEQALAEREQQFQLLADNIPNLCWMADETGAIFWYNSRWYEYTGTTPEEMRGWGWQSVHDPKLLPDVLDRWRASIANGTRFEMVFPLRGADGTFRPFLTRIAPLRNSEGQIVRWFGTNVDILEQQNAQEVLRQADRRKDEFLATLAHELRNPLAPLRNAVQLLQTKAADARTHDWATTIIERQVQSMARMLDDLLDVSRITRGTLTLHRQRVPLASVLEHAIEVAQPLITAHRHRLTVDLPSEPIEIEAD